MTPEERVCGRCEKEYTSYLYFVTKDKKSIRNDVLIQVAYENVCRECRSELAPSHAMAEYPQDDREIKERER